MIDAGRERLAVAHVFDQDNYDVDQVIGVQNIRVQDPVRLGQLALERLGAPFACLVAQGAYVVGARNFGFGHPHVQATTALRQTGVCGVIADSFTPGFWRGCLASGFRLIACPGIAAGTAAGDSLLLDARQATLSNERTGRQLAFRPHSAFEQQLLQSGGIVALLEARRQADTPP